MKALTFGSLAALALTMISPAHAADLPRAPVYKAPPLVQVAYNWTGFYVGGNAGYAWGRANDAISMAGSWLADGTLDNIPLTALGTGQLRPNGFIGGLQAGYNVQAGSWVYGIEGDANYFKLKADFSNTFQNTLLGPGNTYTFASSFDSDWLVTVRPRLGVAFDRLLVYATGGLAVGNQKFSQTITQLNLPFVETGSVSKTSLGWTAGAGLEYALGNRWSLKAEYLHVDLGSVSFASAGFCGGNPACPAYTATHSARLTADIVRAGINYNFDWGPVVARY